jgi:hypothetical protein
MNLPALEKMVDTHLAAYGEPDAARRMALIREVWRDGARLVDPPLESAGHAGIADQAATLLAQFPGHRFERSTALDAHHQFIRYGWKLVNPQGEAVLAGVDFMDLDVDGRIGRVVGFFGAQPAAL